MKLRLALVGLCAVLVGISSGTTPAQAAPGLLQLPWPTGVQHRISGGNTYDCGTHTGSDYYAIDFEFARDDPVSAVAAGPVIAKGNANDGYGIKVVLDHGGGYTSLYAHLNSLPQASTWASAWRRVKSSVMRTARAIAPATTFTFACS